VSSALSMAAIGSTDNEVSKDRIVGPRRSPPLQIHLLNFPSLSPVSKSIKLEGELFDATFGAATVSNYRAPINHMLTFPLARRGFFHADHRLYNPRSVYRPDL
jgi:hypothetical protein